ncbi:hypothetical protein EZJ43_14935 [Pedobacter changchengzhani]|uniref:Uncharacterized protein n=1 Tax=Pedobacter changchengzhani TaxID=2529274 RepID=A0A4R5MI50_9SPHI|nr:hypothetical protein [Pedobacter changchengzhani]TDG35191.1 hypothetical protein EZJ43_14935 [Pedobacter changchengzhani]
MIKKVILSILVMGATAPLMAQTYTPYVSKDSVGILNTRIDVLKASIKLQELKIKESEEEADVEKLRLKLLEANGNARTSSEKSSRSSNRTDGGSSIDLKEMAKLAKRAKNDADDADKALDRFNKQIKKVDDIRNEIQSEERKIGYKKPLIMFIYK